MNVNLIPTMKYVHTHQGNSQRGEKIESSEFGKIQRSSVIDIIILIYELYVNANNDFCRSSSPEILEQLRYGVG